MFDVIIIGAGPAGTVAALTLAKYNIKVLVLNVKDQFYKNLTSSSVSHSISPGAIKTLETLKLLKHVKSSFLSEFSGIHVENEFLPFNEDQSWFGINLNIKKFKEGLVESLTYHKIDYLEEKCESININDGKCVVKTELKNTFQCDFIVDASGRSKFFGTSHNIRENFLTQNLYAYTGRSTQSAFKDHNPRFKFCDDGWKWKVSDMRHSYTWTNLYINHTSSKNEMPKLQQYSNRINGFDITWRAFSETSSQNKIIMCGDSAASLDPSYGQGIFRAIISGENASRCILNSIKYPNNIEGHFSRYNDWYLDEYYNSAQQLKDYYLMHSKNIFLD